MRLAMLAAFAVLALTASRAAAFGVRHGLPRGRVGTTTTVIVTYGPWNSGPGVAQPPLDKTVADRLSRVDAALDRTLLSAEALMPAEELKMPKAVTLEELGTPRRVP